MKSKIVFMFIFVVAWSTVFAQGEDIGHARPSFSSIYGLNVNEPTNTSGSGMDGPHYTNLQFATRGWSGSHGILFNSVVSQSLVSGSLGTTGNTKYANNIGTHSSGAAAIMFYGNGGVMDFLISPPSTGAGNSIAWGTTKMRIQRNGNVGIGTTTPSHRLEVIGASGIRLSNDVGSSDNWMTIKPSASVASLNPGLTANAAQITGRDKGHLVLDVRSNDANDSFAVRTDSNYDGTVDMIPLVVKANGLIGIGTTAPTEKLDINGHIKVNRTVKIDGKGSVASMQIMDNTNTATPAILLRGDNGPSYLNSGSIGIGTTTPSEKLEVNGTIRSKEVKVEASPWPDYVFESEYDLRSLEETEQFIRANKHLPEVPSALEVEEKGIALGEMNALLLKKIEELTLHIIEQEKRIDDQQKMIEELFRELKKPADK